MPTALEGTPGNPCRACQRLRSPASAPGSRSHAPLFVLHQSRGSRSSPLWRPGKHSAFPERGVPVRRRDNPGDVASIFRPICIAEKGPCSRVSTGQAAVGQIRRATPPGSVVLPNLHAEAHPWPGSPSGPTLILLLCSHGSVFGCWRGPVLCSR